MLTEFKKDDDHVSCEYCRATIPIIKEKIIRITAEEVKKRNLRKLSEAEKARVFTSVDDDYVPFLDEGTKLAIFVVLAIIVSIVVTIYVASK